MGDRGDPAPDFSNEHEREQWLRRVLGNETDYRAEIDNCLNAESVLKGEVKLMVGDSEENLKSVLKPDNHESYETLVLACGANDDTLKKVAEIFFQII